MSPTQFIAANLRHYRRIHLAVAMGVAVATAVLTGALLVGDSVRGSLRDLTLQRLGRIDAALVTAHLFRSQLADELGMDPAFKSTFISGVAPGEAAFDLVEPALLLSGTLQSGRGNDVRRATQISTIGCRPSFWKLGEDGPKQSLAENEVAITTQLAKELNVKAGDSILLRLPTAGAIPADSPLGEKSETSASRQLKVAIVLPDDGLARFSLMPTQHSPRNVFVALETLQNILEQPGRANALLVKGSKKRGPIDELQIDRMQAALQPKLEDYGLKIESLPTKPTAVQIAADQLVLPPGVVDATVAFNHDERQPVITYLANSITVGEGDAQRKIPYSTITGVASTESLGPLLGEAGQPITIADDEIVLNEWAADDLQAKEGDIVTVTYYEPESTHGILRERKTPPLKLKAIVPLKDAAGNLTAAADATLTPELPGVTDKESINDWELPFELVEKIRPQDEEYWDDYHTTPKAFVSPTLAARLWKSRWGTTSLMRVDLAKSLAATGPSAVEQAEARLLEKLDPASVGMKFMPVKLQGLAASRGTTPFEGLFLGFSMFLIAAALMLISLLFQLGVEQRIRELGTLAAVGVDRRQVTRLLSREALLVAAIGATVGILLGIGYAWLMIAGLRTWWLAAISTPFLTLHLSWKSLAIGWTAGVFVSWLTIRLAIRKLVRQPASRLLSGNSNTQFSPSTAARGSRRFWPWVRIALILATIALIALGFKLQGEAQAGAFFGSGAAVLAILLGELRYRLRYATRTNPATSFSLPRLAMLNAARNPGRSTLTVGLVAAASFLIVAISAFRLETSDAGTGGFDYLATSDQPLHFDLGTPEGRMDLGFSDSDSDALADSRVHSLRVEGGEDASCLNLYRPSQPRVLGVPDDLIDRGGFAWAAVGERGDDNPWKLLATDLGQAPNGGPLVPAVLDASTAIYSLHLKGVGSQLTIRDADDSPVTLQVVGLLKNSVLQGNLLVSEKNFLKLFPDAGGYKFFLIEQSENNMPRATASDGTRSVPAVLESTLADVGFDVVDAREQLESFLAVQNTYLSTFQSLGALGLLLGTVGLAIVQLRSVLERRGELALMRASGFRSGRLIAMVVLENTALLLGGLAVGCVAAAVALLPQWAPQNANVPWLTLATLLGTIAVVGLLAGWLATRAAVRAPILPALRGD